MSLLCVGPCKRAVRTRRSLASDFPGTLLIESRGMCFNCSKERRKAYPDLVRPYNAPPKASVKFLIAWRAQFEQSRRNRGIPVDGLR